MSNMISLTTRRNMLAINQACSSNIELQTLVMGAISQYESATRSSGLGIQAMNAQKLKNTKLDARGDLGSEINPNMNYHRNMTQWKKWGINRLMDIVYFIDPKVMNRIFLQQFTHKDKLFEILEFALDLKILTDNPDRVPTLNVKQLHESFQSCYRKLGSRMTDLVDKIHDGYIDWQKLGHYVLDFAEPTLANPDGVLQVTSRTMGQTVLVNPEVYKGDKNLKDAMVRRSCSQTEAYIMTKTDAYLIQNFFPKLSRTLRKRKTDEDHIAAPVSGGSSKEDDVETKSKKARTSSSQQAAAKPPTAIVVGDDCEVTEGTEFAPLTAAALEGLSAEDIPDEDAQELEETQHEVS